MKRGLRGQFLPESFEDFEGLKVTGYAGFRHCISCHQDFFTSNTFTPSGWAETQISGMREKCFDEEGEEEDHV